MDYINNYYILLIHGLMPLPGLFFKIDLQLPVQILTKVKNETVYPLNICPTH